MAFKAYMDNIQAKTGKTSEDFWKLALKKAFPGWLCRIPLIFITVEGIKTFHRSRLFGDLNETKRRL